MRKTYGRLEWLYYGHQKQFDQGVDDLNQQVEKALEDLATNPSDPKFLAEYQSALAEYTLYRNAQSNVVKAYKDLDSAIIQNFR